MRFFSTLVHAAYPKGAYISNRTIKGILQPVTGVIFENTVIEQSRLSLTDCYFIGTVVFRDCEIIGRNTLHGDADTTLIVSGSQAFSLDVTAGRFEMSGSHVHDLVKVTVDDMDVNLSKLEQLSILSERARVSLADSDVVRIIASTDTQIVDKGGNVIGSALSVVPGLSLRPFGTAG